MPSTSEAKTKSKKQPNLSTSCGKCDLNFRPRDKIVRCSTCQTDFHKGCQNVSDSTYELLADDSENSGILWFCNICRKTTSGVISKLSNLEIRLQSIESDRKSDRNEMKVMAKHIESLQDRCTKLEKKIQEMLEEKESTLENQQLVFDTVSNLRRDMYKNHDKNIMLQSKVDQMEQARRETNIRVVGLPEQDNSDTYIKISLVQLVGASEESAKSIISTSRMGRMKDDKPRDLIVKFTDKESRDQFYSLRKRTPKDNENRKVYINEDLTECRAKLFYDARQLVKRGKLFGTWTQSGNILVKVTENSSPCAVASHRELRSKVTGIPLETEIWDYDRTSDDVSLDFPSEMSE